MCTVATAIAIAIAIAVSSQEHVAFAIAKIRQPFRKRLLPFIVITIIHSDIAIAIAIAMVSPRPGNVWYGFGKLSVVLYNLFGRWYKYTLWCKYTVCWVHLILSLIIQTSPHNNQPRNDVIFFD